MDARVEQAVATVTAPIIRHLDDIAVQPNTVDEMISTLGDNTEKEGVTAAVERCKARLAYWREKTAHILPGHIWYVVRPSKDLCDEEIQECATLFSDHYGTWRNTGKRVRMQFERFKRDQVDLPGSQAMLAYDGSTLVGHAFAVYFTLDATHQRVAWLTQLVVHTDYRRRGIAKNLCCKMWDPDCAIWGLVTSHPAAVKALERATRLQCSPVQIARHAAELIDATPVTYAKNKPYLCTATTSIINTDFQVDHTEVQQVLNEMSAWRLGALPDGWEFFAFVFAGTTAHLPEL